MNVPPTRKIAARLTVTYAGFEGESVLLEELRHRGKEQPLIGEDLYGGNGLLMFWSHKPIAPWQLISRSVTCRLIRRCLFGSASMLVSSAIKPQRSHLNISMNCDDELANSLRYCR